MKRIILQGKIQGNERGYGFFIPDDEKYEDFFVSHGDLRGAMHGDVVLAECQVVGKDRTVARVLKVIERGYESIVGTYFSTRTGGFVQPDDRRYFCDVFIKGGKGLYARSGEKVVCKILSYPHRKSPEGIVTEILGKQFSRKAETTSIVRTYGLTEEFSDKVLKSAKKLSEPTQFELEGREDFSALNCFTIDGEDSRDFDDAVSIKKLKNGGYELGVYIADVTHYVKENSEIDREAFKRATSVYFLEGVIPMLPEKLSNDLCSLVEGKIRLTLSCIIKISDKGVVKDARVCKSYIKSKARTTYNQIQAIIDGDKKVQKQLDNILSDVLLMAELAKKLNERRTQYGYVDLDVKESVILVKDGKIEIVSAPRDFAHGLIEEFMILANVSVTKLFSDKTPFVYRIHERPDENKYLELLDFLRGLGINVNYSDKITTEDYRTILEKTKDNPAFTVINRVMLRSMQKAKYSPVNKGHFGLGEGLYCHFTSPIRRYPDLFIHRIIKDYLANGQTFVTKKYSSVIDVVSKQSSEAERNAMEAERAMDDYYKVLYISDYVGEVFEGVISGVTPFGIFVELENGVEGLVKIETLKGRFELDQKNFRLKSAEVTYRLGQPLKICVAGVDLTSRRAEFIIFNDNACKKNKKRVS